MQATTSTFARLYREIDWLLVPRRGRRTSAIDVALQGLSVSAQLRSGPESGPIFTLSQSDDLWLAPNAARLAGLLPALSRPSGMLPRTAALSPNYKGSATQRMAANAAGGKPSTTAWILNGVCGRFTQGGLWLPYPTATQQVLRPIRCQPR